MVPSVALAEGASADSEGGAVAAAQAAGLPNSDTGGNLEDLQVKISWGDVKAGEAVPFQLEALPQNADKYEKFKYKITGVSLKTANGVENIDYSATTPFVDSPDFSVTFNTSGEYTVKFSCMGFFTGQQQPDGTWRGEYTNHEITITVDDPDFPTVEQRTAQIVEQCKAEGLTSQYDKALWLHDWMIENCTYDYSLSNAGPDGLLAVGKGTCAAYRSLYQLLLSEMGIESERATSVSSNHEWVLAKLDGAWYHIDPTWNDDAYIGESPNFSAEEKDIMQHIYFGMTDEFAALVHSDHKAVSGSEASALQNHYLVKNGYVAKWADEYAPAIAEKIAAGETKFEVPARIEVLGAALSGYGKAPHQLMALELSNRNWSTTRSGDAPEVAVSYQHGEANALGKFVVTVASESGDASGSGNTGSGSTTTTPSTKPTPTPAPAEKAKPGLTAYGSSYRYGKADGTYAKNEWVTISGKRYYFGSDNLAAKWSRKIDGYWYYFDGKCQMQTGWITWNADKTKSYFDSNGRALTGLQKVGGATYYFNPSTARTQRWSVWVGSDLYYFGADYKMVTGWITWNADKSKSYFGSNGKALKGLQKIGGATYYFNPSTARTQRWSVWVGSDLYYFGSDYKMVTGWVTWNADKSKSYFGVNGKALKGFQKLGGATYYFNPSSCRSVKWSQRINGADYYFDGNGRMHTGWLTWNADKSRSYFASNGKAVSGFQKISGNTYYFDPATKKMVKWTRVIDGATYYFDGNGRMHTGWLQWNADKKWSYFYSNGKMATGTQTIDGTRYTFDANGKTSQAPFPTITGDRALDQQIYTKAKQLGSLSACFNWVKNHTHTNWAGKSHHYSYGNYNLNSSWVIAEAKRMMNGQTTDCYAYAATFACMAKALGYNAQCVAGALPLRSGGVSYHGWVVIYQDGGSYVYDPNLAHSYPMYNFYKITYSSAPLTYIR
ncbi:MAG: hypothetical protein HFJ66_01610 [Eggerthellaceae bacterium]|nr:hypothetical protein [Eggerthellaceae bacterium]